MKMERTFILLFILFLIIGCTDDNPVVPPTKNNNTFAIYFLKDTTLTIKDILNTNSVDLILADKPWLTQDDIEFYDWSSHCIYLKKDKSYFFPNFKPLYQLPISWANKPYMVVANGNKCYPGYIQDLLYLEDFWPYPDIADYDIIRYPIDMIHFNWDFVFTKDQRDNEDVRRALISSNILHEGLSVTIDSLWIDNADTATIRYKITINNKDTDNLYVLDPDKMGTAIFHAFTNGPEFYNSTNNTVYISLDKGVILPPIGTYDPKWFSKIESGESITRIIILKGYPHLPAGNYYCEFIFSNPTSISKAERIISDGRYWMGFTTSKTIGLKIE